ncbi:MAG: hypothetical protein M3447_08235 [Acidobacteriota bacterium]|nr:hypothetical protein [Acidobacteriota bacterium]
MNSLRLIISTVLSFLPVVVVFGAGAVGQDRPKQPSGELRFKAPSEWVVEKPSSSMRLAQYKLPKAEGDSEDASLVLYFFGENQGGSVQANLERWVSQFEQSDGSSSSAKAKLETITVNNLKVATIDLAGTYVAETAPGSGVRHKNPDYRLRAAVIETPKGAHYVKLVGPSKTVNRWEKAFNEYLQSFEFK